VSTSIGLAACGGGGGSSAPIPPAPAPVPPPATTPSIAVQPQPQAVGAGNAASFTVTSPNATSYQWQRSVDFGATWANVAGASSATLILAATALIDSGSQYRVVVSNSLGALTSSAAPLTVRPNLRLLAGALGGAGYLDGQGTAARFDFTRGIAMDASGNIVVADSQNHVLRRITVAGVATTLAGAPGIKGRVDGASGSARLSSPRGVAVDAAGVIWFVDQGTCYLRKLVGGVVTSVARLPPPTGGCYLESLVVNSGIYDPAELAIGPTGDIFVSDRERDVILRVDAAANVTVFAGDPMEEGSIDGPLATARLRSPRGLAFDAAGNLYVAESQNATVRRIDTAGNVTTIAGAAQQRMHLDGIGTAARFITPAGLSVVGQTLVVTDSGGSTVRLLDLMTLSLVTIAGNPGIAGAADGIGTAALFTSPFYVANGGAGTLYVSDSGNSTIRKVTLAGVVTTLAGQVLPSGTTDGAAGNARFSTAHPLASDAAGNIYIADSANHTIRKVTPAGVVTTLAGSPGQSGLVDGTGGAARFNSPTAVVVDSAGNLIVADYANDALRRITPAGAVTTIAGLLGSGYVNGPALTARFDSPLALAIDSVGNIYIADELNCVIRKLTPAGMVSTLAGGGPINCGNLDGPAVSAQMLWPKLVVATGVDEVLFVDIQSRSIRRAKADGSIDSVVGAGTEGSADGQGTAATFSLISGLARDSVGNLYVADSGNHAVRLVRPNFAVSTLLRNPPPNTVLGDLPSIRAPSGVTVLPGNAIALSTEAAIVVD